jgi:hypothetical protein
VSNFSNKLCSRDFMIDSRFVLHDIFNDPSVNFLCTYPLLYTAGLCDVTYIGVYTCLHGRCFLSALYNDIICLALPQSMILFVSSDSSSHTYATSRSSSLRTDQSLTSCRNTACSVFACAVNTHDTAIAFLWKANAANVLLPVDWAGTQLDLVCPLKCH